MSVLLACGDRHWRYPDPIRTVLIAMLKEGFDVLVHGAAPGADSMAGVIGRELNMEIRPYPANWLLGRRAGPIRNSQMLHEGPDRVVAFHDDLTQSTGTVNMVEQATKVGIPVLVYNRFGTLVWRSPQRSVRW